VVDWNESEYSSKNLKRLRIEYKKWALVVCTSAMHYECLLLHVASDDSMATCHVMSTNVEQQHALAPRLKLYTVLDTSFAAAGFLRCSTST
jgi:hypothetical protein